MTAVAAQAPQSAPAEQVPRLRAIGLTHYGANRYGGGTRSEVGPSSVGIFACTPSTASHGAKSRSQ